MEKICTHRIYRVGGDEFALLCSDLSSQEAAGMMGRVQQGLKDRALVVRNKKGDKEQIGLTLSIGVCTAPSLADIAAAFKRADHAAMESKDAGKDRITVVPLTIEP